MDRILILIFMFAVLSASNSTLACKNEIKCEECGEHSEFTWNPSNKYVTSRLSRFYGLDDLITSEFNSKNYDEAKELINEYLELAEIYRCNWNYGNAIHESNRILGLISLANDDVDSAASYLLKSGKSTGSPQLDSFGPDLDLANELLSRGKTEEVKTYLVDIKTFWNMDRGVVDLWLQSIDNGEIPVLNRYTNIQISTGELVLTWILFLWPLILSFVFTYLFRNIIIKKMKFFIVSLITGYLMMFATIFVFSIIAIQILVRSDIDYNSGMPLWFQAMNIIPQIVIPLIWILMLSKYFEKN